MSADADEGTLRCGFQLDSSYRGHRNPIRHVTYNSHLRQFCSLDDRCLKLWKINGDEISTHNFPSGQFCYLTTIIFVERHNLYLAPALDRTLKVYDERMNLVNSLPWGKDQGTVAHLTYNPIRDEVITSGAGGIKIWACVPDDYRLSDLMNAVPQPSSKQPGSIMHQTVTWRKRKKTHLLLRYPLKLPFVPKSNPNTSEEAWVPPPYLNSESQLLFCFFAANLYAYNIAADEKNPLGFNSTQLQPCWVWTTLHTQPITCVSYIPSRQFIITGGRDAIVKVWRQKPGGTLQMLRTIGSHTKSVVSVSVHPSENSILTAALDGSAQLWSLDTFEPMHRMKLAAVVQGVTIVDDKLFYLYTEGEVKTFRLIHLHDTFAQYNSPIVDLEAVNRGQVLCVCEDSSARLVDVSTGESVSTTVPQLSTKSLVQIKYSNLLHRLFALLANGEVHVYACRTNPSIRKEVWEHTRKDRLLAMCIVNASVLGVGGTGHGDGGGSPEKPADAIRSHAEELKQEKMNPSYTQVMIAGTQDGDVIFLDIENAGAVMKRFPAHKNTRIQRVE
eukprot:gene20527-24603_t